MTKRLDLAWRGVSALERVLVPWRGVFALEGVLVPWRGVFPSRDCLRLVLILLSCVLTDRHTHKQYIAR